MRLLANGAEIDAVNAIINRLGFAMDNQLNNPFKPTNTVPIENKLDRNDWQLFVHLLENNKKVFCKLLTENPNDWSVEEAEMEWNWITMRLRLIS